MKLTDAATAYTKMETRQLRSCAPAEHSMKIAQSTQRVDLQAQSFANAQAGTRLPARFILHHVKPAHAVSNVSDYEAMPRPHLPRIGVQTQVREYTAKESTGLREGVCPILPRYCASY